MGIREYKPTSPGRRSGSVPDFAEITKWEPEKSLIEMLPATGGRNCHGRITCRGMGGGHKRYYRKIDFKRNKDGVKGKVEAIEYDPYRSAYIALIAYEDGEKRYILCPLGLKVGDTVESGEQVEPEIGNCMPLQNIPLGLVVHNIEMTPGGGGKLCRAAGCEARLLAKEGRYAHIALPSGEMRMVNIRCRATIGQIGNLDHQNVSLGKAGRSRWMGIRPIVRGIAKNPVDHPMGGGSAKGKGHIPQSPTGVLAKGGKTRSPRALSNRFILRRRKGKEKT
jgi:large subunit ribosomal protein L2